MCCAASIDPAPPGRIEWVLLQTSKFQSEIAPLASSDAFSFVTMAGPYGSQLCSCSRIHCTRTGTPGIARAINDAIPFMEGAEEVTVLSLQQAPSADAGAPVPRLDITEHLRAHGIEASYERVITGDASAVDLVLNRAADAGADLTVMGAYGQSGFPFLPRSTTTRDILRTMTTPVLLSR